MTRKKFKSDNGVGNYVLHVWEETQKSKGKSIGKTSCVYMCVRNMTTSTRTQAFISRRSRMRRKRQIARNKRNKRIQKSLRSEVCGKQLKVSQSGIVLERGKPLN